MLKGMIPVRDIFILHKIYTSLNFTFILLQRSLQRGLKRGHQSLVVQNTGINCVPYIAKNKKIFKYLARFFIIFSAAMTDFIKKRIYYLDTYYPNKNHYYSTIMSFYYNI